MSEVSTGPAGKNKNALADGVSVLTFLKGALLHRSQEILQPEIVARIKFIPEHHRNISCQHAITNLVIGAYQILGAFELRQVELQYRIVLSEDTRGDLF